MIAGAPGSGKTNVLKGIIWHALYKAPGCREGYMQFVFVDPRRVELYEFKELPHTIKYACDDVSIVSALQLGQSIIEQRLRKAQAAGVREWAKDGDLYIFADDLHYILLTMKKESIQLLRRICAWGRSVHVHLISTSSDASRKVIPAEIDINIEARLALHCYNGIESRQIIRTTGAEKLLYHGEGYYLKPGRDVVKISAIPEFTQQELLERVKWWTDQDKPQSLFAFFRK